MVRDALVASVEWHVPLSDSTEASRRWCQRPVRRVRLAAAPRGHYPAAKQFLWRRSRDLIAVRFAADHGFTALLQVAAEFAVRRSCQTMALWIGWPVLRSQTTVVSRWLVMPMAAICSGLLGTGYCLPSGIKLVCQISIVVQPSRS